MRKRAPGDPFVLSCTQQRLWYLYQLEPDSPVYNVPFVSRLRGNLDIAAFERAHAAVLERHEILRTVLLVHRGNPLPVLRKKWHGELVHTDLRELPEPQRELEARRLLRQESVRPFDLARDLSLRSYLFRLANEEYLFLHVNPHIAFEGGSIGVLYRDLSAYYHAFRSGFTPDLPELRIQYYDFALWQRQALSPERVQVLREYWRKQLADAPSLELPLDLPRPATHSFRGARHFFSIPPPLLSDFHTFLSRSGQSAYRGLLAAFNVLLYCYSNSTDICLGSPFAPRLEEIQDLIGFFVNTVVVRNDLSGDPTFSEALRRVSAVVKDAIAHSDLPFDMMVDAVRPPRDPSRTPLFQVNFRALREPFPALQLQDIEAGFPEYVDTGTSKFDLALELESSMGVACYFEYCSDLFREETIVQMVRDFETLLRALIAEPEVPLSKLQAVRDIRQRIFR